MDDEITWDQPKQDTASGNSEEITWDKKPAPREDVGAWTAAGRGAVQGVTFGFGDEIAAARSAAPDYIPDVVPLGPVPLPARTLAGMAKVGAGYLTGDADATKPYEESVKQSREANELAKSQHPVAYIGGELAGALPSMAALPEGAIVRGAGTLARMGRGAITGAEFGALQGAGEGTDATSRLAGAGLGAGEGALIGGASPVVGGALEYAYNKTLKPVVSTFKGWIMPEREAAARVASALEKDRELISAGKADGMTVQDWIAAKQRGEPVTLADLGSANTQALLRSAANTSPDGRAQIEKVINDRFLDQGERVSANIRNLISGGANAHRTEDEIVALYEAGRGAKYRKAFSDRNAST